MLTVTASVAQLIGDVIADAEVDDVFYSLSSDHVVRVNDADTGELVTLVRCASAERARALFDETVATARRIAGGAR